MTSTWPSQAGPAPMPMVGTGTLAVISAARAAGMLSRTMAYTPASAMARAPAAIVRACTSVRPCNLKPPNLCTDCGVMPR